MRILLENLSETSGIPHASDPEHEEEIKITKKRTMHENEGTHCDN